MGETTELLPLFGLTFLLGLRHGMDPDHLVAVDNIARHNAGDAAARAPWCGLFFSLGHGAVVMAAAAALALVAGHASLPHWIEGAGQAISIGFLFAIGLANLAALASTRGAVRPRGVRAALWARLMRVNHPLAIAAVGAAFAVSMDTLSQAAVFSLAATGRFAWGTALALGAVFTLGMLVVDAANGWWVARLVARTGAAGALWARRLTLAIALLSLALAAAGLLRLASGALDAWYDTHALAIGAASTLLVTAVYWLAAARLQRARR
ncbi:MAG: nickel transporter [Burkholderiales bacterium]|nr:nickel transporter [Burkholderiales bacterium]